MTIADKLQTIAENEQKIYDKGKQDEYDRFWDLYQDYGNRRSYRHAFAGYGWTVDTFKPKYKMTPIGSLNAVDMFNLCNGATAGEENALDYRKFAHLLDFSEATSAQGTFLPMTSGQNAWPRPHRLPYRGHPRRPR